MGGGWLLRAAGLHLVAADQPKAALTGAVVRGAAGLDGGTPVSGSAFLPCHWKRLSVVVVPVAVVVDVAGNLRFPAGTTESRDRGREAMPG